MPEEQNNQSLNGIEKAKIQVSKTGVSAPKKTTKRGRPKKATRVVSGAKNNSKTAKSKNSKKLSPASLLVVAVLTAVLVGGGMYAWYQSKTEEIKTEAALEKRSLEEEMQKQISVLKNRLNLLTEEKQNLAKEKEKLSAKANKLNKAQLTFINSDLGISFFYPAVFGDPVASTSVGKQGSFWQNSFSDFSSLVLEAATADYLPATSSQEIKIINFFKKDDKYFLRLSNEEIKEVEVKPLKVLSVSGREVLILDANSLPADLSAKVMARSQIVAVVNLEGKQYAGLVWHDKDTKNLGLDKLGQILETLRFF